MAISVRPIAFLIGAHHCVGHLEMHSKVDRRRQSPVLKDLPGRVDHAHAGITWVAWRCCQVLWGRQVQVWIGRGDRERAKPVQTTPCWGALLCFEGLGMLGQGGKWERRGTPGSRTQGQRPDLINMFMAHQIHRSMCFYSSFAHSSTSIKLSVPKRAFLSVGNYRSF